MYTYIKSARRRYNLATMSIARSKIKFNLITLADEGLSGKRSHNSVNLLPSDGDFLFLQNVIVLREHSKRNNEDILLIFFWAEIF